MYASIAEIATFPSFVYVHKVYSFYLTFFAIKMWFLYTNLWAVDYEGSQFYHSLYIKNVLPYGMCVCVCVCVFSHVQLIATPGP